MGAGHQKDQVMIRCLAFSASSSQLHLSRKRRGPGNGVKVPSCLHDEASRKSPKVRGSENFLDSEHIPGPAGDAPQLHRDRSS